MRLRKLNLIAYGPFTGKSIDFESDRPGLHIVYGANEAGKSATLRAITDLLFGIPVRTSDTFLHKGSDLRIGAILENSEGILEIIRRKGRSNTLLDNAENPINENVIEKYLPGINRELFATLFGISHEMLIEGGKQIVSGAGEIGQSLFSAGAGITNMSKIINSLSQEAGELFKSSGSKPKINKLISEYKQTMQEQKDKVLSANDWKTHDKAIKDARAEKERLEFQIKGVSMKHQCLDRLIKAIPRITAYKQLMHEINDAGEVVLLPEGFQQERIKVQERQNQAEITRDQLEKDIEDVRKEMGTIDLANCLLENQNEITELFQSSGSFRKAMRDMPGVKSRNHTALEDAEKILKELNPGLGLEKAETLKIPKAKLTRIRNLGRKIDPLVERLKSAEDNKREQQFNSGTLSDELRQVAPKRDLDVLEDAIEEARKDGSLAEKLAENEALLQKQENKIALTIERLGLWQGTAEDMRKLALPADETIDCFEDELDKLYSDLSGVEKQGDDQSARNDTVKAQIKALESSGKVPSEEELLATRNHRDDGWHLVIDVLRTGKDIQDKLKEYDPKAEDLADAFEKAMKSSDAISDRLRSESDRVAQMDALRSQLEIQEGELKETQKQIEDTRTEQEKAFERWHKAWADLTIEPLSPKEMRAWLGKCHKIIELCDSATETRTNSGKLGQAVSEHVARITSCIQEVGVAKKEIKREINDILNQAKKLVKDIEQNNHRRESLEKDIKEIAEGIEKANILIIRTQEEVNDWQKEWGNSIKQLQLNEESRPDEVETVLGQTQSLFERLDQSRDLQGRIAAIEKDADGFRQQAKQLCDILHMEFDTDKADKFITEVNNQLQSALQDATRLTDLKKTETENVSRLKRQQDAWEQEASLLKAMCEQAKCKDVTELAKIEEKSDRMRTNQSRLNELQEELAQYSAGQDVDALIQEADAINPDSLPGELENANTRLEELNSKKSDTDQEIGREETSLATMKGSLDAAELTEKAQGVLAVVSTDSERYLSLRFAELILGMEIERYRQENQGPILEETSSIFSDLTLGSFEGLVPDFGENDDQVLRGVRNGGNKISVESMSDGTCDQLFLALRLACIKHRLKDNGPVPLILDDILVNFDDERSAATLKILESLAEQTQVIFFTHHKHLTDLAEKFVDTDSLKVHTL